MRQGTFRWGRVIRQGGAVFMGTIAVCIALMGARAVGSESAPLGEYAGFVTSVLNSELGAYVTGEDSLSQLDRWGRLVVGQSTLLRENGQRLALQADDASLYPAGQSSLLDHDDVSDPPEGGAASDNVVARTLTANANEGYASYDGMYLYNKTSLPVDMAALATAEVTISMETSSAPQILIVHTHGTEAYTPDGTDVYTESDNSRTVNNEYNVVRIGNEMEQVFTDMGLTVIHDETLYDYPAYTGAYDRSAKGVAEYLAEYPSIKIVLDVHRDALIGEDGTVYKAVTEIDGVQAAQVMMVMGSSEGGEHPNWQQNLTLALKIQKQLNAIDPTLARPITLRSSRYNQQLSSGSLLVEVGSNGNTLQEAIQGARLYAQAAGKVLLALEK